MTALKLLIADDDPNDAKLVAYKVKRAGYAVDWKRVDTEADFIRELPGNDLVICDFAMPAFSPGRALELIRDCGLGTPLLLVSGSISAETAAELMSRGAVGYLLKDQLDRLGQAVSDALAHTAIKPLAPPLR
jgi:DNA-binding NtrC family response regulator